MYYFNLKDHFGNSPLSTLGNYSGNVNIKDIDENNILKKEDKNIIIGSENSESFVSGTKKVSFQSNQFGKGGIIALFSNKLDLIPYKILNSSDVSIRSIILPLEHLDFATSTLTMTSSFVGGSGGQESIISYKTELITINGIECGRFFWHDVKPRVIGAEEATVTLEFSGTQLPMTYACTNSAIHGQDANNERFPIPCIIETGNIILKDLLLEEATFSSTSSTSEDFLLITQGGGAILNVGSLDQPGVYEISIKGHMATIDDSFMWNELVNTEMYPLISDDFQTIFVVTGGNAISSNNMPLFPIPESPTGFLKWQDGGGTIYEEIKYFSLQYQNLITSPDQQFIILDNMVNGLHSFYISARLIIPID